MIESVFDKVKLAVFAEICLLLFKKICLRNDAAPSLYANHIS